MRMLAIRDRLLRKYGRGVRREDYKELWVAAHKLSAPASTFPWPDTHAVASFCMLLEALVKINRLEKKINSQGESIY
ncbi:MAG: hypothetical protein HeimC2_17030 [Candidatus Heimdallarchaeota archaeon LC_2]|nr:MAG: hypothetical protein HeimC2_17030 [Candidatus Heimdallarchaeota archaeon LC_2]